MVVYTKELTHPARSDYESLLQQMVPARGDVLHTNTIQLLDGRWAKRLPAFREGNVLVSIMYLDTVAVVDLERRQHQPTILDDYRLLVFDNLSGPEHHSRVLEVDPLTQEIGWQYAGSPEEPLFSDNCGSAARCKTATHSSQRLTTDGHWRSPAIG